MVESSRNSSQAEPGGIVEASGVLLRSLLELAREREDVSSALRTLNRWLTTQLHTEGARSACDGGVNPSHGRLEGDRRGGAADGPPLFDKVLTPGGALSQGGGEGEALDRRSRERRPTDLELISRRSAWKAEACRFAVAKRTADDRQGLNAKGGSSEAPSPDCEGLRQREDDLRARREEIEDCFPWMLDSYRGLPSDRRMEQIAACYDNVALAAECTLRLIAAGAMEPSPPADLLYQIAEVQSALLASLEAVDLRGDSDQRDLFMWLKSQTLRHRIYVDRHMKLDDPADFTASQDLAERLHRIRDEILGRRKMLRRRTELVKKVRYHLAKATPEQPLLDQDLASIEQALEEWVKSGFPLMDCGLGEALRELAERVGDQDRLPATAAAALAAQEERRQAAEESTVHVVDWREPAVHARAVELLRGRTATLIAGQEDLPARDLLTKELELTQVRWVDLSKQGDGVDLDAEIRREEVDLVLIAERLSIPLYADFKRACLEHKTPFVRLPGGYEPGQVAQQVLRQVGRMLSPLESEASMTSEGTVASLAEGKPGH